MTPQSFVREITGLQEGLRRFLRALCCGDASRSEDLAQETLIKAYLNIGNLRDCESIKSWIYRIAYRCFIDDTRRGILSGEIDEAAGIPAAPEYEADNGFRYQRLHAALAALGPQERSAILLYYFEGYSSKEIAEVTDSTDAAVRRRLSRARNHLESLLSNEP